LIIFIGCSFSILFWTANPESAWNNFQAALSFQHLLAQISDWHMHGHLFQALTRRILKRAQARKLSTESFCVQGDAHSIGLHQFSTAESSILGFV
jgi:protoheme ferro-lyase